MAVAPGLADAIRATAGRLGIDPSDLATAISYETGGTFNPGLWGGKGGNHLGLIQFGQEERAKYGARPDQTPVEQMSAVENYLKDRGVKPGMGLLDVYSTINAGRPGLYNRSDAANGGAPGTVLDKVTGQMYGHRMRAKALLGDESAAPAPAPVATAAAPAAPSAPVSAGVAPVPPSPGADTALSPDLIAALQRIPQMLEQQNEMPAPPQMDVLNADPIGRARRLSMIMAQRPVA